MLTVASNGQEIFNTTFHLSNLVQYSELLKNVQNNNSNSQVVIENDGVELYDGSGSEVHDVFVGFIGEIIPTENLIIGTSGNDTLNGTDLSDTVIGGLGNDSFFLGNASPDTISLDSLPDGGVEVYNDRTGEVDHIYDVEVIITPFGALSVVNNLILFS